MNKKLRVLLVEPDFKSKFPPLGLMKLSTYHKLRGDYVQFTKGCIHENRLEKWDRIYISSIFTYHWGITLKTIEYYINSVFNTEDIFIGGVLATLLGHEIRDKFKVTVIKGLINKPGILGLKDKYIVDNLIPDYGLLDETDYNYPLKDCFIGYATRGCPNRCDFCAVHRIEPEFVDYLPLKKQIMCVEEVYGQRQNLILMDNNILASKHFEKIVNDIIDLGFHSGAKLSNKKRYVDFNQGTDMKYLNNSKMSMIAKTAIDPLRIAFDHIEHRKEYEEKIRMAHHHGLLRLSNYILFNYLDTPNDFYERLKINILLNEELGTKIYSFPMKYIPLDAKDRTFVGKNWNRKLLRGIQCILLATRGLISPKRSFFEAAFGSTYEEFLEIVYMPNDYIIYRKNHANDGALDWKTNFRNLTKNERSEFIGLISDNPSKNASMPKTSNGKIRNLLIHYSLSHQDD